MAKINRISVLKQLSNTADLQVSQGIPTELGNTVIPTLDINPNITNLCRNGSQALTATAAIYTAPTDCDFYLDYVVLGMTKDATSDLVVAACQIVQDGRTVRVAILPLQTTTAGSWSQVVSFPKPVKVDRGSAVSVSGAFTVGTCDKHLALGGHLLE